MFANYAQSKSRRRGVVLVLILGMLGLLALIGVTFATFSGQAKVNARNFSQAQNIPDTQELMDFALSQLIDDTGNPQSAIRGHSLKRDMYGNDALHNGSLVAKPSDASSMNVTGVSIVTAPTTINGVSVTGLYKVVTDILIADSAFYGYDFTRWTLRFGPNIAPDPVAGTNPNYYVGTNYEILVDDVNDASNHRVFYVRNEEVTGTNSNLTSITGYVSPEVPTTVNRSSLFSLDLFISGTTFSTAFTLDGRFLHAFNGPGVEGLSPALSTHLGLSQNLLGLSQYADFRVNANILNGNAYDGTDTSAVYGNPNTQVPGMDEDYDACDLENWFLALQSADGQVVIPSFHRPGILTAADWTNNSVFSQAKFLRPRAADGHDTTTFPNLLPDATTGKVSFDVDNDADGVTDSVWLDLGFPARRNTEGQLFKPLYSFLVIGLNGKIPLNTAGNLQLRNQAGSPLWQHASHLGYSPSEIDPSYALQNYYDHGTPRNASNLALGSVNYWQADNAGISTAGDNPIPVNVTQLRNLLAGTHPQVTSGTSVSNNDLNSVNIAGQPVYLPNNVTDFVDSPSNGGGPGGPGVSSATPPVAGRWGEPTSIPSILPPPLTGATYYVYSNAVRAGSSGIGNYGDSRDDNFNGFDPFGSTAAGTFNGETVNFYDASGSIALAVERMRRFVTPMDLSGTGLITTYNRHLSVAGPDRWGRVSYLQYHRPEGVPLATANYPSAGLVNTPVIPDKTNNPYHGYESYRVMTNTAGGVKTPNWLLSSMPFDTTAASSLPTTTPTFDVALNSNLGTLALDEADEMNLYQASNKDHPYSFSDLEWLYRLQDTDGGHLQSRLSSLAPISFLNPGDGHRRRRMFSIDSWDPTNFVWANDNPYNLFPNNSRFKPNDSANAVVASSYANANPTSTYPQTLNPAISPIFGIPPIALRDRRINLNFPLPVSNDPQEAVRQKWIRETYELLKYVLPPNAIDTPQELAQLSQFVVNIIDFRDPDATCTKFVNTDLQLTDPIAPSTQSTVAFRTTPLARRTSSPGTIFSPFSPFWSVQNSNYLVQYGMEHNPIAINEVLAFQHIVRGGTGTPPQTTNGRMFVELVNTLTQDGNPALGAGTILPGSSSDLDLSGWDFVITNDDYLGRPDPITGQLPFQTTGNIVAVAASGDPVITNTTVPTGSYQQLMTPILALQGPTTTSTGPPAPPAGPDQRLVGTVTPTPYYYVLGANPIPTQVNGNIDNLTTWAAKPTANSTNQINVNQNVDFIANTILSKIKGNPPATENGYYWLHLRRPVNPFDPTYDTGNPWEKRIVVDSFRFILNASKGIAVVDSSGNESVSRPTNEYLYSLQRLQPYRGGHAVPPLSVTAPTTGYVMSAYGYSEQTEVIPTVPTGSSIYYGQYVLMNGGTATPTQITGPIRHSLGLANSRIDSNWDLFPFHDRDFASVAELLLVPGCPPGLFTKQFVEVAPPWASFPATANPPRNTPPGSDIDPTSTGGASGGLPFTPPAFSATTSPNPTLPIQFVNPGTLTGDQSANPRTYPYLVDNFFYTAQSENSIWLSPAGGAAPTYPAASNPITGNPPRYVGGPGGAGWYRMLEFFEVPSPALGAIGEVAQGTSYDWARQDMKPGLLNLNLIIDEEVFFSLMSETWLKAFNNRPSYNDPMTGNPVIQTINYFDGLGDTRLNVEQIADAATPRIVTQIDATGKPSAFYSMSNVGYFAIDPFQLPTADPPTTNPVYDNRMKSAFSDFLKLRHGGSGFAYAHGYGLVGQSPFGGVGTGPPAMERPYHSLSYPDINFTIMRPAVLPPSVLSTPVASFPTTFPTFPPTAGSFVFDTGLKNPVYFTSNNPVQPPPIPPRRQMQIPDVTPGTGAWNASILADSRINTPTTDGAGILNNPAMDLTSKGIRTSVATGAGSPTVTPFSFYLGSGPLLANAPQTPVAEVSNYPGSAVSTGATARDRRLHPLFRTEWLQKVTNLTTVRTHQYAVWITVGFFEVLNEGDPLLGSTSAMLATDKLGPEIGLAQGENIRYRSFFVIDRTKAYGFSPQLPTNFRDCIVYRQTIE
ncbi:hypothetical protein [Singulisphaera sp. PoT]|uniref:hypothetical protein n=1 Tax=Singulisphaera sp. PoT TaxID=3411797 RepID=UPI003BF4ED55